MASKKGEVHVSLSHNEALVLFAWLASLDESGTKGPLPGSAEQTVLWKVEGQLESALPDVVAGDFQDRVAGAKKSVLARE